MPQPQSAHLPAPRLHPPHAAKTLQSHIKFPDRLLGTANDFAHAAGVPVDDLTAALRIAASAPPRAIDLGLVDGRPFVNLVSGGFGSRVTVETNPERDR